MDHARGRGRDVADRARDHGEEGHGEVVEVHDAREAALTHCCS